MDGNTPASADGADVTSALGMSAGMRHSLTRGPRKAGGRAATLTAVLLAATLGISGCSGSPEPEPSSSSASVPAPAPTATADVAEAIGGTPPPLDPGAFAHGDFVGALQIDYLGDRSSASAQAADAAYNAFFQGNYDGPYPGKSTVLRLTAMGDPRDGDRLLRLGAVIDNITDPNSLVIGIHNVMTIDGSVELNGQVFDQNVAGASGVLEIGDRITIWTPNETPGAVNRYVYEVVNPDGGDAAYSVVDADANIDTFIYRESPSNDFFQLTTYICWPPNQLAQRLVTRLKLVESSIEPGSVLPFDPA